MLVNLVFAAGVRPADFLVAGCAGFFTAGLRDEGFWGATFFAAGLRREDFCTTLRAGLRTGFASFFAMVILIVCG
ncbi:MAG TPA: hypothetical protein VMV45_10910 [Casimicrobiaceae bacterium]|nr:hypothetical protein [Casimicrobiaceae bacterium]